MRHDLKLQRKHRNQRWSGTWIVQQVPDDCTELYMGFSLSFSIPYAYDLSQGVKNKLMGQMQFRRFPF